MLSTVHREGTGLRRAAFSLALHMALGLGGCVGPTETKVLLKSPLVICYQPLVVTTELTAPGGRRISWSPSCGATYLEVTSADHRQVFWSVQGDTGRMAPGVTYGSAPGTYSSRFGPYPLEVGKSYAARVGVMVDEDSFYIFGEGVFVH